MERKFEAGIVRLLAADKQAGLSLLTTSRNRNGWGVTDQALEQGLPSIKGKPLGCGKEYKLGHYPPEASMDAGKWVDFAKPGTYALGMAKIDDEKIWGLLEAGTWGPISVVVNSYQEHCSICGQDITDEDIAQHEHIAKGPGYIVSDSFAFARVDFVDIPAFPQAGIQEILNQANEPSPAAIELAAGYYSASQSNQDTATGAEASGLKPGQERHAVTEKTVEQLKAELTTTTTELATKTAELTTATEKLQALQATQHQELVDATAKARFEAGIVSDLKAETERIKPKTDEALTEMKADADLVKKALNAKAKKVPKAGEYGEEDEDTLKAAIDAKRADLGFPARKKEA